MKNKIIISFLFAVMFNSYGADEFIESACERTFYMDTKSLDSSRLKDLDFTYSDRTCCCNEKILNLFKIRTKKENHRVNPAVDIMLQNLAELEKTIRLQVKEVENLKQINAMYSFPEYAYINKKVEYEHKDDFDGDLKCRDIDLSNPTDMDYYIHTVDMMENGGSMSYSASNPSGATGRYQIMPKYAKEWCKHTEPKYNCCVEWKSSQICQDQMFEYLTKQNISEMMRVGLSSVPLTNCTLYIAHQQGVGGLSWLLSGKLPRGLRHKDGSPNFIKVKDNVVKNLSGELKNKALLATTTEELREIYLEYWNNRFGDDILSSSGSTVSVEDFVDSYDTTEEILEKRKTLWREGIILELQRTNLELKKIKRYKK